MPCPLTFNGLHGVISQMIDLFINSAVRTQILHGVISQMIDLFINTAVRTSDPTRRYIPDDRPLHKHRRENLRSYTALYPR
jgi:hypothetical protein